MKLLIFLITVSPFNEANFVALSFRSISVMSNPAGIGVNTGAELFFSYHSGVKNAGITIGNLGAGISHTDTNSIYEIGTGVKLPGAFSIGYARQFGDTTENIIGLLCVPNQFLLSGMKMNLSRKKYMHYSAGLRLMGNTFIVAGEFIYEGIENSKKYIFGFIISPLQGVKINFLSDTQWNWHGGLALSTSNLELSGIYSYRTKKFSVGLKLSAQGLY
ncbi:MAG: hypothetical protein N3A65_05430 [candidate division WOR-3 bacterium]|nr:hypothetical protein [candidate division WOR-3 bacterium]